MKKLLAILALLLLVAAAAAFTGIWLAGDALPSSPLGGSQRLVWTVGEPLQDYASYRSVPFLAPEPESLATVYRALVHARSDPAVKSLALYIQDAAFGLAKAQEIRGLLTSVAAAGKQVDCYLETAGEGGNGTLEYYLASACDQISMPPSGELNLLGLYAAGQFFRGTLDKLRIEPQFTHVGRYKSAAEAYTESAHSEAAREAISGLLDDLFAQLVDEISSARALAPERVRELVDGAPYSAQEALDLGLVDDLAYPDEFRARLAGSSGKLGGFVDLFEYDRPAGFAGSGTRVAVVFAQGTILRGTGGVEPWSDALYLGASDLRPLLRSLADRDAVQAVVLRIDSPGGSALGSDLILREVSRLAETKPLIVSMSDVAASGGYYIAAHARKIVAHPATLTGSIGVVGGKLVTRKFQEELLGVTYDPLQRGDNAGIYSTLERFTPEQLARYEELMNGVYGTFVGHVASGRSLEASYVDEIAQGRVWTGKAARDLGLVDELGGLDRALELVRSELGLEAGAALSLDYYPRPPRLRDLLSRQQEILLPIHLRTLASSLQHEAPRLLELPPELAALSRPF